MGLQPLLLYTRFVKQKFGISKFSVFLLLGKQILFSTPGYNILPLRGRKHIDVLILNLMTVIPAFPSRK